MKILSKPKSHDLPRHIKKSLQLKPSTQLPSLYENSRSSKKKVKSSLAITQERIQYLFEIDKHKNRPKIRQKLSKSINFDVPTNKSSTTLLQNLFQSIHEPTKTLSMNSQMFKQSLQCLCDIFGQDFQIKNKQIISVLGVITKKQYLFFTSPEIRPYSLCCFSPLYVELTNFSQQTAQDFKYSYSTDKKPKKNNSVINTDFKCPKCKKSVAKFKGKKQEHQQVQLQKNRSRKLETIDIERQKISMSIMIASGKYRKIKLGEEKSRYTHNPQNSITDLSHDISLNRYQLT